LTLDGYLGELFDSEVAHFREHKAASREFVRMPSRRDTLDALWSARRQSQAGALLSSDPEERRTVAGWAAEAYFQKLGRLDRLTPWLTGLSRIVDELGAKGVGFHCDP